MSADNFGFDAGSPPVARTSSIGTPRTDQVGGGAVGPLARARQVEEAAGFVIALAFAGHDPAAAVPALR